MRWMLARIMALNLLSLYTLIFALFGKTDTMINQLAEMKKASAAGANYGLDLGRTVNETQDQNCFKIPISCEVLSRHVRIKLITIDLLRILCVLFSRTNFAYDPLPEQLGMYFNADSSGVFTPNEQRAAVTFNFTDMTTPYEEIFVAKLNSTNSTAFNSTKYSTLGADRAVSYQLTSSDDPS